MTTPAARPPNWWQRNWKWVVPAGCGGCLTLAAAFTALLLLFVFSLIKRSDVYVEAIAEARSHPAVVQALGEPIEPGFWVSGSISTSGPSGTADFSAPLHGPTGRGTLYVVAEKQAGIWSYEVLEVEVDGRSDRIDLLAEGDP
jgi:hypothetical protein